MDKLFDFHHSIITLIEDSGIVLKVVASRGYEGKSLGGTVSVGTGVIGMVAKKRKLMRLGNLSQQRAYVSTIRKEMELAGRTSELEEKVQVPGLPDVESQIAIPLMIKKKLIGVFSVESREQRTFSERDEMLATIVANQAASAIHNAILFHAEKQHRKELTKAHKRVKKLNETLEDRVRDRTRDLELAYHELQETQTQLVQSGKMASLGMLAAGIAHEINTPISAIKSNADVVNRAIDIILKAFKKPEFAKQPQNDPQLAHAFRILEETNTVNSDATERVIKIIKSLKSFARLDQAELESIDLHESIDDSLILLHHLIKNQIVIVKHYGSLPRVKCNPAQINQVLMHVLTNAVQAIEEKGTITITTQRRGKYVTVKVVDTGTGIEPENLNNVFDPGFTTKGVGVGTGLGLSIVYRIIEEHNGTIDVQSKPGSETCFTIKLPIM